MKKVMLVIVVLLTFNIVFAQKCKYEKNEVDKFTKKTVKITKPVLLWKNPMGGNSLSYKANLIDSISFLSMRYSTSKIFTVEKGSHLMFLLDDESTVTLKAIKTTIAEYYIAGGATVWYSEPDYLLTKDDIVKLKSNNIKVVRFYTKDGYIEKDVKEKKNYKIKELLNCL